MLRSFLVVFIISHTCCFAQSTVNKFLNLGIHEKKWVLFHPFIAKKCFHITNNCLIKYNEILIQKKLDTLQSGGLVDAYRHGLWMAMLTQNVKKHKALSLGKAHEKSNYRSYKKGKLEDLALPDKESSEMDLFNNCIGANLGLENPCVDLNQLSEIIIKNILQGNFVILKRDTAGNFVSCDNQPIQIKNKSWKSNKCLVPSSLVP